MLSRFPDEFEFEQRLIIDDPTVFHFWFTPPDIVGYIPVYGPAEIINRCIVYKDQPFMKVTYGRAGQWMIRNYEYYAKTSELHKLHSGRGIRIIFSVPFSRQFKFEFL